MKIPGPGRAGIAIFFIAGAGTGPGSEFFLLPGPGRDLIFFIAGAEIFFIAGARPGF